MAADQWRKRLNGASITGCSSLDQYRIKKKKLELMQNDLKTNSYISLEWDGNQKKVVARREQVGLSQRNLRPFSDSAPHYHKILADVLLLPHEIFDLENLTEVLSYEAWQTHLSENERDLLMRFLPIEVDKEQVLQALFAGDNFHFGNPFLKWGASLCSGHLHPDAVIQKEQQLKEEKKSYYSELQVYHNDILSFLLKLKEKWESCKDPEQEIVQKLWRPRRVDEKRVSSHSNESMLGNTEQDVAATSESSSWVADEKACSSDNQISSVIKGGGLKKRMHEKGFKGKNSALLTASGDVLTWEAKSKKGVKLQKHNIQKMDGKKYMSCLKVSKKQHELIKNTKQSGRSIQSSSLNRILGDIDSLQVQPYEVFMEEEQRKLHEYWLKLVKEDLPAVHSKWRGVQLQKREITKLLEQDFKDKLNLVLEDDEMEDVEGHQDKEETGSPNMALLDVEKEDAEMLPVDQKDTESTESESSMADEDSEVVLQQNQSPQQVSSNDGGHTCSHVDVESENKENLSKSDDDSSNESDHSENLNVADPTVSQEVPISSADNAWPTDSVPHTFNDSTACHEYTSASGLPLIQQATEGQQNKMIDLESDLHEESTRKVLIHGHSEGGSFSSYANEDRNDLLQSLFKDQGMLSYHSEHKQTGLDFQPPKNLLMENSHFNGQFHARLQSPLPLEGVQKRENDVFMQHNMSENIYSDGSRYLTPRQEQMPSGNMQDWVVNPVRMSAPFQHQLNGGELLSQNWFSGDHHQVHGGWAAADNFSGPSQSIASANNANQSLFSVLPQCNQLRSSGPYDTMGSTEQFISQRNNGILSGGTSGVIRNSLQQPANPLDYLGGRDAATSLMPDDMGWMSLPHQNPTLHDLMGKPYSRSWNQ